MSKGRSYTIRGLWLGAALLAGLSGTAAAAELSAEETVELERLLYRLNFDPGEIDGVVDERTHTAIRQYQEFAALTLDGEPSPALLAEMRAVAQVFDEMKAAQSAEQAAQQAAWAAEEKARAAERAAQQAARAAEEEQARAAERAAQEAAEQAARVAEEEQARAAERAAQEAAEQAARAAEEEQARAAERAAQEAAEQAARVAEEEARAAERAAQEAAEQAARVAEEEQARAAEQAARAAEEEQARAAAEQAAQAAVPAPAPVPAPTPSPAPTSVASTTAPPPPKAQPAFDLEGVISRLVTGTPAPDKDIRAQPNAMSFSAARAGKAPPGLARKAARARVGAQIAKRFTPNTLADSEGYKNFKKGYAAAQSGDLKLAIDFYTRAIETGDLKLDHLADAYYNRANVHHYNGTFNFAIQDYSSAILNKPDFPGAYYNRGFAFEANRQHTRAVADFMKARALGLHRLGVRSPDLPPPRP